MKEKPSTTSKNDSKVNKRITLGSPEGQEYDEMLRQIKSRTICQGLQEANGPAGSGHD